MHLPPFHLLILKPYMALLFRRKQGSKKDAVVELAAINAMTDVDGESKEKQDTVENVCYEKIQSKLILTFNREIRPYKVIVQIVLNSVCKV